MYRFFLVALQFILVPSMRAQDATTEGYTDMLMRTCKNYLVGMDQHSYYAYLKTRCDRVFDSSVENTLQRIDGIMISSTYFLGYNGTILHDEGCNYTVEVFSEDVEYEADLIEDGNIKLFKLKGSLKKDSRAKPVEMIEAGEGPQPGTQAFTQTTFIDPVYLPDDQAYTYLISLTNATIISKEDCTKFVMDDSESNDDLDGCGEALWVKYPQLPCNYYSFGAVFVDGKLAGVVSDSELGSKDGMTVQEFFNVAHYRDTIQRLSGI